MQTHGAPWSHVHTATIASAPGWQIQRDPWGSLDFFQLGRFVPDDRVPSHVRDELLIALARVTPTPVGDLAWDDKPGRPAEPTRTFRATMGPVRGPDLAPTGRPWLTDDERQRLADRIRRGQ